VTLNLAKTAVLLITYNDQNFNCNVAVTTASVFYTGAFFINEIDYFLYNKSNNDIVYPNTFIYYET
jgi:hypothetical protein